MNIRKKEANRKLDTIEEENEKSLHIGLGTNSKSVIQTSLKKKDTEEDFIKRNFEPSESKKEDIQTFGFAKLPKLISSTISKPAYESKFNSEKETGLTGSKYFPRKESQTPLYTPGTNPLSYTNNYSFNEISSRFTETPRQNITHDSVIISNFNPHLKQRIINELKKFGEVKDNFYIEEDNVLLIEYDNPMSVVEAFNHSANLRKEVGNQLIVEMAKAINYKLKYNLTSKRENKIDIASLNVSLWNKIKDFFFNW